MGVIISNPNQLPEQYSTLNVDNFNVGDVVTVSSSAGSKYFLGSKKPIEKTIIVTTNQTGTGNPFIETAYSNHTNSVTSSTRSTQGVYTFNFLYAFQNDYVSVEQMNLFKYVSNNNLDTVGRIMYQPGTVSGKQIEFETRNLSDVLSDDLLEDYPVIIKIYSTT